MNWKLLAGLNYEATLSRRGSGISPEVVAEFRIQVD